MRELDAEFRWPELPSRFDAALREVVAYALDRFDVLGVVASGTILRGSPDPASDLDVYVIHNKPVRQRVQKFFRGIPAEIFVNPPATIRGYFRAEYRDARPLTAHMLSTGWVIMARDPVVYELCTEAGSWLAKPMKLSPSRLVTDRYMAATLYEDALDLATRDKSTALLLLGEAVVAMIRFWYKSNGQFLPRSKEQLDRLFSLDSKLGEVVREFFLSPVEKRWSLAKEIADRTIGVQGFFEWESEPEAVSEESV